MEERSYQQRRVMEGRFGLIGEIIMEKSIQGIVEIGEKPVVERRATARGVLHLKMKTGLAIQNGEVKKGDVLEASTAVFSVATVVLADTNASNDWIDSFNLIFIMFY